MPVQTVSEAIVEELTPAEARSMFDEQTMYHLGLSGPEFLRRLDAGEYTDDMSEAVIRLTMLAPFGR